MTDNGDQSNSQIVDSKQQQQLGFSSLKQSTLNKTMEHPSRPQFNEDRSVSPGKIRRSSPSKGIKKQLTSKSERGTKDPSLSPESMKKMAASASILGGSNKDVNSALKRDVASLKKGLNDDLVRFNQEKSDPNVRYLRSGSSVRKNENTKDVTNSDSALKSVEKFMYIVFSLCALYLCFGIIKDLMAEPTPVPTPESAMGTTWTDKLMPIFNEPIDFTLYGGSNKDSIKAEDIIAHLSNGVDEKKIAEIEITQKLLELFNDQTLDLKQFVEVEGLDHFESWSKVNFKVRETKGVTDSASSTADNNKDKTANNIVNGHSTEDM